MSTRTSTAIDLASPSTTVLEVEPTSGPDDQPGVRLSLPEGRTRVLVKSLVGSWALDLMTLTHLRTQLAELTRLGGDPGLVEQMVERAERIENHLVGDLLARGLTTWEVELETAEGLHETLGDAIAEPEACLVGTCSAPARIAGYCLAHDEAR